MNRTVTIISGGLDSTVLAYLRHVSGDEQHMLSFNYGQRHLTELDHAGITALHLASDWDIIDLTESLGFLTRASGSSLVDDTTEVPDGHYAEDTMKATVVPNRNMVMLSLAIAKAVAVEANQVATGVHAGDHFIYPDCRPEFIDALAYAARAGNEGFLPADFAILTPFVNLTKADIVTMGDELGVPFRDTWSCYKGGLIHCGRCGTCVERAEAFAIAGVEDPTEYADPDYWRSAVEARA